MVFVNWKSINRLKFKELYPMLMAYYRNSTLPTKSKSALARFLKHAETFEYREGKIDTLSDQIFLVADNLPDPSLKGIVSLPITLELINPTRENITAIVAELYSHTLVGGFRGIEPLYKKIKQSYLGITREDVADVLKQMELKQYQRQPLIKELQAIITTRPLQHVQVDLIDVSEWSYFNNKTTFLMNVKDLYSKFGWSIPVKNKSTAVIAERLQDLFLVEGFPEVLQTDNGTEFVGEQMVEMADRWGIEMRHGEPYKSSTQGSVEKFNSTVRNLIHQHQVNWKVKRYIDHLPFLIYSYNTTVHSATGYTPFQVFRKKDEKFGLDAVVQKAIRANAKMMIKKNLKSQIKELPDLVFGDRVRVSIESTKTVRKMTDIMKEYRKKKRHMFNFTTLVYTVIEVVEHTQSDKETARKKYRLDFEPDRTFFRQELLKVDVEELIPLSHKDGSKPADYHFGVKYNPEEHLAELHSKVAIDENDMSEGELEEHYEEGKEDYSDYSDQEEEKTPDVKILPKREKKKKLDPAFEWG